MSPEKKGAKKKFLTLGDILPEVVRRLEKEKNPSKETIDLEWKTVAGDSAFKHSRAASLRKKVLTIRVDSSAWLQELDLQKRKLLKGLKRVFGKDRISEIRFKIGEF